MKYIQSSSKNVPFMLPKLHTRTLYEVHTERSSKNVPFMLPKLHARTLYEVHTELQ